MAITLIHVLYLFFKLLIFFHLFQIPASAGMTTFDSRFRGNDNF
jgi:hypothetical protein